MWQVCKLRVINVNKHDKIHVFIHTLVLYTVPIYNICTSKHLLPKFVFNPTSQLQIKDFNKGNYKLLGNPELCLCHKGTVNHVHAIRFKDEL
jgi:hypothetical protein